MAPAASQRDLTAADSVQGFGLYIHWPFCLSKCPYCDFNSHVRESIDQERWQRALLQELDHYGQQTKGRRLTSLFFGGGTPSLMAPDTVAALIAALPRYWALDPGLEITLEANPTSSESARFAAFAAAGVNRLSLGVQALNDTDLKALGRQHTAAEALAAVDLARRHFARFSFDLIYARPQQTARAWRDELRQALDQQANHLSLYQLTIEPNTAFHGAWRRGELTVPEDDVTAGLFDDTQSLMAAAGLPAYEVSNHARPGEESQHNLIYWRYQDYVGIGPGAHGRLTDGAVKLATRQHRAPEAWLAAVENQGHATRGREPLESTARLTEMTMMGLRLSEGLSRQSCRREFAEAPETLFEPARLDALQEAGYLELDDRGLRTTASGRLRLNAVVAHLLGSVGPG